MKPKSTIIRCVECIYNFPVDQKVTFCPAECPTREEMKLEWESAMKLYREFNRED